MFAYQWNVNGSDIAGASASSYMASAAGSYACRVTATNQAGSGAQTSAGQVVSATASAVPTKTVIRHLGETNSVFAVARSSTPLSGFTARHEKRGTVFSFLLDQPARVTIAIQSKASGRRVARGCRPDSRRLRKKPRCMRTIAIATLTRTGHAGANRVAFSGRVAGKALKPGRYQAVFIASDQAGASQPETLGFRVVKR
jgi:hypothetical protein